MASRAGFLPPNVPKTIGDAYPGDHPTQPPVSVWVDQYCVNQKDGAGLSEQVGIMDMVYSLATVTLIAACGEDASFGLPGVSSTPLNHRPVIKIHGRTWVPSETRLGDRIKECRWWSRAWTYQGEAVLSAPCLLHRG